MTNHSESVLAHFGAELRRYRILAGITQEQLGERVSYTGSHVSQIETARRMPSEELADAFDRELLTDGALSRLWPLLSALSTRQQGFRAYLAREPRAATILSYESHFVPGLLQTEAYANALVRSERPAVRPEEVQARVALRMSRQDVLTRDNPVKLWCVIDESVLHRQVGDPATMRDQLARLLACLDEPSVVLQVYPYRKGVGASMGQSFVLAQFDTGSDALHVDASPGVMLPGDGEAVAGYRYLFDHIRATALPEDESALLVKQQVEE